MAGPLRGWQVRAGWLAAFIAIATQVLAYRAIAIAAESTAVSTPSAIVIADPAASFRDHWGRKDFTGHSEFEPVVIDGVPAIRAVGRHSSGLLYRPFDADFVTHPMLAWRWRVERTQSSADLRYEEREDFDAAIFVLFDRPGLFNSTVPTLIYAWTATPVPAETVIPSAHFPDLIRSIVVRQGSAASGQWVAERRNLTADYRRAFGRAPPGPPRYVAIFIDNDQTGEPAESAFGAIVAEPAFSEPRG